ncbi:IMP dehydrogenase [Candidatus Woesearchaeota archaeon]|nr:IMP dehydrogenase [Candidatus Woesearchaeota archaeon]
MQPSGLSAEELFKRGLGITYLDFSVLDTFKTSIPRTSIDLSTDLGKGVKLATPIIASPMDTVTNAELCIALAEEGGIGVLHFNHKKPDGSKDLEAQMLEIERVKRSQSGFIENPVTVAPHHTIREAVEIGTRYKVGNSRIDTFPVTEDGKSDGKLVGLLRKQDYSPVQHTGMRVGDRMLHMGKLTYGNWPLTLERANQILWDEHIPSLPIVDEHGHLKYLVTRKDIDKGEQFPLATKDEKGRLRVLFSVSTHDDDRVRVEAGFAAGADGVVIDTSQGFTIYEEQTILYIIQNHPDKLVLGGNISTPEAAIFLSDLHSDSYRNGQGSGSICTTAGALGISRAGAAGVYNCARELKGTNLRTIADGGLREVGDILKAIASGAHAVMLGNMLAGCDEGPGEVVIHESGKPVKEYRGMGSKEANVGGIRGYSRLPQGVKGQVPYRGSIHTWIPLIRDGLLSAFHVLNCQNQQSGIHDLV